MTDPQDPAAFNPLPAAVVALAVVIFGIEALFSLADRGIIGGPAGEMVRLDAIERFGFFGPALDWMIQNRRFPPELLARFLTYPFLHFSLLNAVMVCVFILALGKMVAEAFGNLAMLAIFFAASIGGALVYGLLMNDDFPLIGGFPGVYGLIGGFTFLIWVRKRALGERQITAFNLIGMLLGIQLLFALLLGGPSDWVADVSGFFIGFGLCFLLVPGGWARLREALRNR
ncbi:MAG: rhomboid family intramembrane serine protease [Mangrovicoccus sp.]|nr:rhomboid family intramembrane serine protease [Mangrovicoccus sp.]